VSEEVSPMCPVQSVSDVPACTVLSALAVSPPLSFIPRSNGVQMRSMKRGSRRNSHHSHRLARTRLIAMVLKHAERADIVRPIT